MICNKCGAENKDNAEFCTKCGTKLGETAKSLKHRDTAGATALRLEHRDPITVLILSIITFGIYGIYWMVKTSWELNEAGADIPTAWLIIVPIISIWWEWKFCEGVEQVTNGEMSTAVAFLLLYFLGVIGAAIIQSSLNKVASPV